MSEWDILTEPPDAFRDVRQDGAIAVERKPAAPRGKPGAGRRGVRRGLRPAALEAGDPDAVRETPAAERIEPLERGPVPARPPRIRTPRPRPPRGAARRPAGGRSPATASGRAR